MIFSSNRGPIFRKKKDLSVWVFMDVWSVVVKRHKELHACV